MSGAVFGLLSAFDHTTESWETYKARIAQWFIANTIDGTTDAAGNKRRAILLSALSDGTYKLAADLARPKDVQNVPYEDIVKLLDDHFTPKRCGFGERYKFYAAVQQSGETFAQWAARLRGLSAYCEFSNLGEALRDRFVMGMLSGPEKDKLFARDLADLTLAKAVELAESIHCARAGSATAQPVQVQHDQLFKISQGRQRNSAHRNGGSNGSKVQCQVCGYYNHKTLECRFAKSKCRKCNATGHLKRMCKNVNFMDVNAVDEGDDDDGQMCKETDILEVLENINKIETLGWKQLHTRNQYLEETCGILVSSAPPESDEPYLRINTLKTTFNVGEKKAIYCEGQHLTGDLEWYDPTGAKIPPKSAKSKRIVVERSSKTDGPTFLPLMIKHLILEDSGTYICKAGDLSANITIFVGEKVVIKESEEDRVEDEGRSVDLSCQAKGTPTPEIQWYDQESKPIENSEKYKITYRPRSSTSVLRINDLNHTDPGTYKCKATQEKISHFAEKFFHLIVHHKPINVNEFSEREVYAIRDEWKNITCKARAFPAATFIWSKKDGNDGGYYQEMKSVGPDHRITSNKETDGYSVLTLHITDDTLDAQYKCTMENPKGRDNFEFHVSLGNKPEPPTAVEIHSATANNITFEVSCDNCIFYKDDGISPLPENLPVIGYVFEVVPRMEGFTVPYWENGITYKFDITSDSNKTFFIIYNLEKSTEYHVRVATLNMAGQSDWLDVVGFPKTTDGAATLTKSIVLLMFALFVSI